MKRRSLLAVLALVALVSNAHARMSVFDSLLSVEPERATLDTESSADGWSTSGMVATESELPSPASTSPSDFLSLVSRDPFSWMVQHINALQEEATAQTALNSLFSQPVQQQQQYGRQYGREEQQELESHHHHDGHQHGQDSGSMLRHVGCQRFRSAMKDYMQVASHGVSMQQQQQQQGDAVAAEVMQSSEDGTGLTVLMRASLVLDQGRDGGSRDSYYDDENQDARSDVTDLISAPHHAAAREDGASHVLVVTMADADSAPVQAASRRADGAERLMVLLRGGGLVGSGLQQQLHDAPQLVADAGGLVKRASGPWPLEEEEWAGKQQADGPFVDFIGHAQEVEVEGPGQASGSRPSALMLGEQLLQAVLNSMFSGGSSSGDGRSSEGYDPAASGSTGSSTGGYNPDSGSSSSSGSSGSYDPMDSASAGSDPWSDSVSAFSFHHPQQQQQQRQVPRPSLLPGAVLPQSSGSSSGSGSASVPGLDIDGDGEPELDLALFLEDGRLNLPLLVLLALLAATGVMLVWFVQTFTQLRAAMGDCSGGMMAQGAGGMQAVPVMVERNGRLVRGMMLLPPPEADEEKGGPQRPVEPYKAKGEGLYCCPVAVQAEEKKCAEKGEEEEREREGLMVVVASEFLEEEQEEQQPRK